MDAQQLGITSSSHIDSLDKKSTEMSQTQPVQEVEERRPVVLYKGIQQREASQLLCPIHKGLLHDPVKSDKCKHVFCRSCLTSWVELQGHCPLDSHQVDLDKLVPAQATADKLNSLLIHCQVRSICSLGFLLRLKSFFCIYQSVWPCSKCRDWRNDARHG